MLYNRYTVLFGRRQKDSYRSCGIGPVASEKGSRECRRYEDGGGCTKAASEAGVSLMLEWRSAGIDYGYEAYAYKLNRRVHRAAGVVFKPSSEMTVSSIVSLGDGALRKPHLFAVGASDDVQMVAIEMLL